MQTFQIKELNNSIQVNHIENYLFHEMILCAKMFNIVLTYTFRNKT